MITQAILSAFNSTLRIFLGPLWGSIPGPPAWFTDHLGELETLWSYVRAFDTWIPVNLAFTVAAAVVGSYVLGWLIGLARVIASYLTFGGGAT
jgi:hypothetical protein